MAGVDPDSEEEQKKREHMSMTCILFCNFRIVSVYHRAAQKTRGKSAMRRVSREECRFFRKGDEKGTKSSFFRGEIPPAAWYDIGIRETVSLSEPFAYGVRSSVGAMDP